MGNTNNGIINWAYTITEAELDFLAAGETVTVVYTITLDDANGGISTQDVTVGITGSYDAPVIAVVDVDAGITEGGTLTDSGSITFTDVDLTDTPSATKATSSVNALKADGITVLTLSGAQQSAIEGAFSISPDAGNTNNGTINWDYTITESELDFLADAETVTAVFTITVDDGDGGTDTQDVTVSITGSNDAPVIAIGDIIGNITEGAASLNDTGSITFADLDLTDRPTATEATSSVDALKADGITVLTLSGAQQSAIEGAFSISPDAGNTNNGTINWDYTITEGELDFLAANETVTAVFTITVDDGHGGTDTQNVTVLITGSNDAPTVSTTAAAAITEAADAAAQNLSDSGTVSFDDIDTNDVVDISFASDANIAWSGGTIDATLAADLVAGFSTGTTDAAAPGTTPWTYSVLGANLDFLDAGETITFSYTITATDNNGATDTDTVSFTINGSNDAPTVSTTAAAAITEAADAAAQNLSDSGTVSFDDIDTNDVVDISFASDANIAWSGGTIDATLAADLVAGFSTGTTDAAAPGTTPWTYSVLGANLDFLDAGETITFSYTITATDNNGATDTDTVSFTINGSNDAPTVSTTAAAAITEAADAAAQNLSDSGTVSFDDIDTNDVVDISFASDANIAWSGGTIDATLAADLVAGFSTGTTDAAAPGTTPWTYSVLGANLDFLDAGETITFSYTITATDNNGATDTDTVSFTINGSNDAPTVSTTAAAAITEAADAAAQNLSDSGTVSFDDIDTNDVVDISFASDANIAWSGGTIDATLAADLVAGFSTGTTDAAAPGTTPWTYSVLGANLDFLDAGETITFSYTITATDNNGATDTDTVSFTINGSNDAPTVSTTAAAAITEAADAAAQNLSDSGTVSFDDIDTNDVVDISFASDANIAWSGGTIDATLAADLVAGFSTGTTDAAAPGTTPWTYSVLGANLDFLDAGETITFSYTITATDNNGATDTDTVSFTINGSNDAPTVSTTAAAAITEAADAAAQNLSDSGTVSFDDIDTNDVVDISFASDANIAWSGGTIDATLAADLVAGFSTGTTDAAAPGTTPWTYSVLGANLDFLDAGETITFSYTITATDNNGATDSDTVSFTITGSNDAPTVSATAAAAITEAADASAQDLSDSGTVSFSDIDTNDVIDISFASDNNIAWSGGTIDPTLAARLVTGFSVTGLTDAAAPGQHRLELHGRRRQPGFPGCRRDHHLQLHASPRPTTTVPPTAIRSASPSPAPTTHRP